MLLKLSKKLTSFCIIKHNVEEEERDTYEYCFEILLSTIFNVILAISIALMFKRFCSTVIFLIVFSIMRALSGGYHANTHLRCMSIFVFVNLLHCVALNVLEYEILKVICYLFSIFNIFPIFILAPVESANKPINKWERQKLAIKSKISVVIIEVFGLIIIAVLENEFGFSIILGITAVSVSVIFGKIKTKKKRT